MRVIRQAHGDESVIAGLLQDMGYRYVERFWSAGINDKVFAGCMMDTRWHKAGDAMYPHVMLTTDGEGWAAWFMTEAEDDEAAWIEPLARELATDIRN